MLPLFLIISLFLTQFLAAAHTENFDILSSLAEKENVKLDLSGQQSYAIYEHYFRTGLSMILPGKYHMRLIVGHVECKGENDCDFVANAFDMDAHGGSCEFIWGSKTHMLSRKRLWMANTYWSEEEQENKPLPKHNTYTWAGPTKKLTIDQIDALGNAWCSPLYRSRFHVFFNNSHHLARALFNKIKQDQNAGDPPSSQNELLPESQGPVKQVT
ncbi:hypothetical protein PspLS_09242 [Pyricularia sp. CBS 133598]|nr:hypothetical protein PspLS_09242 [Pyricularia sp. CBS 133598]